MHNDKQPGWLKLTWQALVQGSLLCQPRYTTQRQTLGWRGAGSGHTATGHHMVARSSGGAHSHRSSVSGRMDPSACVIHCAENERQEKSGQTRSSQTRSGQQSQVMQG